MRAFPLDPVPALGRASLLAATAALPVAGLVWRADLTALATAAAFAGLGGLIGSLTVGRPRPSATAEVPVVPAPAPVIPEPPIGPRPFRRGAIPRRPFWRPARR